MAIRSVYSAFILIHCRTDLSDCTVLLWPFGILLSCDSCFGKKPTLFWNITFLKNEIMTYGLHI
jgi:hypothetical protein